MKILSQRNKNINECLGVTNEEYIKLSQDIRDLIIDRYADKGKCDHMHIIRYLMEEIKYRHFGKTQDNDEFSQYECDLFIAGMIVKYALHPEVQKGMQSVAYCRQLENGLSDY